MTSNSSASKRVSQATRHAGSQFSDTATHIGEQSQKVKIVKAAQSAQIWSFLDTSSSLRKRMTDDRPLMGIPSDRKTAYANSGGKKATTSRKADKGSSRH